MKHDIASLPLIDESDAALARTIALRVGRVAGLLPHDQTRFATGVSEVVRAALGDEGGTVDFAARHDGEAWVVEASVAYSGAAGPLSPRHGSMVAARRMVDRLAIDADSAWATVTVGKLLPPGLRLTDEIVAAWRREAVRDDELSVLDTLRHQKVVLARALAQLQAKEKELEERQSEIVALNHELTDTNAGLIALHNALSEQAAELDRARMAAEEATRSKSAFLAHMSHEIRTPLNSVLGFAGVLQETELDSEQSRFADMIENSGRQLLTIINEILDFSKIEAGAVELESIPFDVADAVEDALDNVAQAAQARDLDLSYIVEPGVPATLIGDAGRVRQILVNLLANAVKFTHEGEISIRVARDGATGEAHIIRFSVRDSGIGIPQDRLQEIFADFQQADMSTTRVYGGTGLGLAISKRLTELMDGEMAVDSVVGEGSVFRFTIAVAALSARDGPDRTALRGRRFAIVGRDSTARAAVAHMLRSWDAVVRVTDEHAEVADWVGAGVELDAVLVDHAALGPGVSSSLLSDGPPVVLMIPPRPLLEGPESAGFSRVLGKPVKQAQLYEMLDDLLHPSAPATQPATAAGSAPPTPVDGDGGAVRPRILLADDSEVNQEVVVEMLRRHDLEADVVSDGRAAVTAVAGTAYDVVLMDLHMPALDGLEATREIRRLGGAKRGPWIIGLTASATNDDRSACFEAGMDDYVTKPVSMGGLVTAIGRAPLARE